MVCDACLTVGRGFSLHQGVVFLAVVARSLLPGSARDPGSFGAHSLHDLLDTRCRRTRNAIGRVELLQQRIDESALACDQQVTPDIPNCASLVL
jgi:hypothetical protein